MREEIVHLDQKQLMSRMSTKNWPWNLVSHVQDVGDNGKGSGVKCADSSDAHINWQHRSGKQCGDMEQESYKYLYVWPCNFSSRNLSKETIRDPNKKFIHLYVHLSVIYNNKKLVTIQISYRMIK